MTADPTPFDPATAGLEPVQPAASKPKVDPRLSTSRYQVTTATRYPASQKIHGLLQGRSAFPITLADGVKVDATELKRAPLLEELKRLGVAGVKDEMGRPALLDCYRQHLDAEAQEARR